MSSDNSEAYGQQGDDTHLDPSIAMRFMIQQMLNGMQTVALVKIEKVNSPGGIEPVGTVDVRPLVHQMTGNRQSVMHGVIYDIPYFRLQGGVNAVVLDPQAGDIGICVFCSQDSSSAIAVKDFANPNSYRRFDWADGLYLGGFLNAVPEQYVQFAEDGIHLVSPQKIVLRAPSIDLQGDVTASSSITAEGDISSASDVKTGTISLKTHVHPAKPPSGEEEISGVPVA